MPLKKRLPILAALAVLTACGPADSGYHPDRTPKMNTPSPRIEKLFAQTKPVCFGRFLIDVPATAQVVWGPTSVNDSIASYPDQGYEIRREINDKTYEIKAIQHRKEPSALLGVFDGPNAESKIIVGYETRHDTGLVQLHSYIKLGKHAFVQSAPSAALGRDDAGVVNKTGYQRYVSEMQDIAARLRVREESEVPAEPGICLDSGFVAEAEGRYHEMTSIGLRFPEYPDVTFSIQTQRTSRVDESNSLEWSLNKGREFAGVAGKTDLYARIKTLREGARRIGDWEGAEKLGRKPAQGGVPSVHEFLFMSVGVPNDMMRPIIDMSLHTGVEENTQSTNAPSLKDDDAVALWDKLTTSIRVRPTQSGGPPASGENPPRPGTQPPKLPLGTVVPSLQPCPQAGVWECAAKLAAGDKRRYFPQGMALPTVIVRGPERSLWQKLRGDPANRLAETTWTLVSHETPEATRGEALRNALPGRNSSGTGEKKNG